MRYALLKHFAGQMALLSYFVKQCHNTVVIYIQGGREKEQAFVSGNIIHRKLCTKMVSTFTTVDRIKYCSQIVATF